MVEVSFLVFLLVVIVFSFTYIFSFFWKPQNKKNIKKMCKNGVQNSKRNYLCIGECQIQ